jgi:DNA-binding PadR family transcriptional regulator
MDRERLKGNLDLLLLSVLSSGPAHGYAIISALRDRSQGTRAGVAGMTEALRDPITGDRIGVWPGQAADQERE